MSNERSLVFKEGVALQTAPGMAKILALNTANEDLTLDDLGLMSEWVATAWQNLAGEEYKPVVISERGYVADAGNIVEATYDPTDSIYDDGNGLERDCE